MILFLYSSLAIAAIIASSAAVLAARMFRRSVIEEHAKAELDAASRRFDDFDKSIEDRMQEVSYRGRA